MIIGPNGERLPKVTESSIEGFFGDYRWLSNFAPCSIWLDFGRLGKHKFSCSEAAYMAFKIDPEHPHAQHIIESLAQASGVQAKAIGKTIPLRKDWESIKAQVMLVVLIKKFKPFNSTLREKLLATGAKTLVETNNWGDCYWGVCNGKGENMLGRTLMMVRTHIRISEKIRAARELVYRTEDDNIPFG